MQHYKEGFNKVFKILKEQIMLRPTFEQIHKDIIVRSLKSDFRKEGETTNITYMNNLYVSSNYIDQVYNNMKMDQSQRYLKVKEEVQDTIDEGQKVINFSKDQFPKFKALTEYSTEAVLRVNRQMHIILIKG